MEKSRQAQGNQPALPGNLSKDSLTTIIIIGVLALVILRWNDFVSIFVNVMLWLYDLLGRGENAFGFTIILFTILIRLVTWPLNAQQLKSAKAMQEFQNDKEWQKIQKKYAKDREKLAQEQMRLYSERGISPFSSCLPLLIQMPVWFAVIQALNRSLASTPLALLQFARSVYTWPEKIIPSLSATSLVPINNKFLWLNLGTPEFTHIFGFNIPILVLLVGITSYFQSKLLTPVSSNPNDQSAQMSRSMTWMMPIMMIMFAYAYSSGFALYLLVSNIFAIIQALIQGKASLGNLLPGGDKQAQPK